MRFPKFLRPERRKSDLDEEIAAHLALAAADKQEEGHDAESAKQEARREFGNVAFIKDRTREAWGWVWLERLLQDARYALRQMRKSPGFAASVIGTLALGIAAATTMFTVVDHVLFPPLPYPHASQLVELMEGDPGANHYWSGVPYLDLAEWRQHAHSFEQISYYNYSNGHSFLGSPTTSTEVSFLLVSPSFFKTLGVRPQFGSGLPDAPETFARSASDNDVVLSDMAWRTIFDSDAHILDKTVQINGKPYTVTGVMPHGFAFPYQLAVPQVWAPLSLGTADEVRNNNTPGYAAIARLRPGVKPAAALAELSTLQKHIAQNYTDAGQRSNASYVQLHSYVGSLVDKSTARALYALLAAALLLWLIACVNSTNLLLACAIARQREMALRGALGASRWRLTQQLIVESCILSGIAAILGAATAVCLVTAFHHALKNHLPFEVPASINLPVFGALIALTLISAVFAAAWPAWIAAHSPIEPALKQGGQQSGSSRHHRLRGGLVIAEIAMSLTLLAACGLMLRTLYSLSHVPLGFRTDHIIVANLDIPTYRFSKINATTNLYQPLLDRVQYIPGIDAAGLMTDVPLGKTYESMISLYGTGSTKRVSAYFKAVSPSLQHVFGFQMLAGRYFNAGDTAASSSAAIVNQAFAHAFAPHQQDLNKVVGSKLMGSERGKPGEGTTIIGILDDFRQRSVDHPPAPEIELCLPQLTPKNQFYTDLEAVAMDLAVRTQLPLAQIVPELRAALKQASPELEHSNITTMDQIVEDSYGSQRLAAHLLESFAAAALLLCIAGLYGLLAYVVSQRTREMGVRFALGAQRGDVIWLILRQAGVLVLAGVALGLALAFATSRFIRSYLYGVKAHDAWTLAAVAVVLLVAGAAAAYLPARRAAHVNPVEALRAE